MVETDKKQRGGKAALIAPALLLAGCVGLLQWHSIRFWSAHVDAATGWAWSVLLEAVALWLWYRRGWINRSLAAAASLLLLVGPLYVVSDPAVTQIVQMREAARTAQAEANTAKAAAEARKRAIPVLEQSIEALERQMAVFLTNSEKRSGWLPAIEQTQAALAERRRALSDLYLKAPPDSLPDRAPPHFAALAVVAMQCLALVLYQVTGILAITHLSKRAGYMKAGARNTCLNRPKPEAPNWSETPPAQPPRHRPPPRLVKH